MKIYCINLERSKERQQNMQAQFERLALPVEFINAVDGRALSSTEVAAIYSKWRTRFCHGKDLSRGEIGCALSHIEFYRRVVAENAPGFVFEDDVELGHEVKSALEKIESFLAGNKAPCLVQLPGLDRDLPQCGSDNPTDAFAKVSSAIGAYAYGVNPAAASLLLKAFSPIKFPIDYYRYLIKHYGLNFYVYNSKPISVDMVSKSTVGEDRFKVDAIVRNRVAMMLYKLWRLIGKTIDGVIRMFKNKNGGKCYVW